MRKVVTLWAEDVVPRLSPARRIRTWAMTWSELEQILATLWTGPGYWGGMWEAGMPWVYVVWCGNSPVEGWLDGTVPGTWKLGRAEVVVTRENVFEPGWRAARMLWYHNDELIKIISGGVEVPDVWWRWQGRLPASQETLRRCLRTLLPDVANLLDSREPRDEDDDDEVCGEDA